MGWGIVKSEISGSIGVGHGKQSPIPLLYEG